MLNIIQNTIGAIRRVGESVVRAGLKMWLPFTKAEPLGEELVVNGDFSTNSDWSFGANTIITGGKLVCSNSSAYNSTSQSINMKAGTYIVTYTIDSISNGVIYFGFDGINGVNRNTSGTYTEYLEVPSNSSNLYIVPTANGIEFEISNVSVEEYAQETPDISGNDNNAILKTGKCLVFAGNDSVETVFPSSKDIKTIAFWIYPTHSASGETLFYFGGTGQGTKFLYLDHLTLRKDSFGGMDFSVYVDGVYRGNTYESSNYVTLAQNEWQRVVLTTSTDKNTVSDTFDVAYKGFGSHGRFKMSDLQIYGAEFTTDDIAYDYANPQKLVTDNASSNVTLNDLHAWWHMSEGNGTIAFDSAPLIGDELVVNGDFATNSDWSFGTNTTITEGKLVCSSSSAYNSTTQSISMKAGTYIVTYTIDSISGGFIFFGFDGVNGANRNTSGTYTEYIVVPSNSSNLFIAPTTNGIQFEISNVSAKEVYNIDGETYDGSSLGATYDDAQERIPQLGMMNWSKGSNLLEYSEDFSEWTNVSSGTGSDVVLTENQLAPDGTLTATKMFFDKGTGSANSDFSILQRAFTYQSNTASVYLRADTAQKIMIRSSNTFQLFDVSTDWVRINKTDIGGAFKIGLRSGYGVGEPNTSTIYVWGAQAESGTTASAYRRTNGTAVTDATLISCATDSQKDILGNAVRVKGSGFNLDGTGYAEVLYNNVFDIPACNFNDEGGFSLMGWIKFDYVLEPSGVNTIYYHGVSNTSSNSFSILTQSTNKITSWVANSFMTSTTTHNKGDWVHFALTRDNNGNVKLYINKTVEATLNKGNSISNSDNKVIGWGNGVGDRFYHERIDDIKFYNRGLSSDEIEQNYNATKSGHNN